MGKSSSEYQEIKLNDLTLWPSKFREHGLEVFYLGEWRKIMSISPMGSLFWVEGVREALLEQICPGLRFRVKEKHDG